MQQVRGSEIAMIFQDPMTSLNPTMKVGKQIEEMLKEHRKEMSKADRKTRAIELLSWLESPIRRHVTTSIHTSCPVV